MTTKVSKAKDTTYSSSSIKHLSGRDSVRQKASMYIGPTDGSGIFTLLREILDNARDENLAGHCSSCEVLVDDDGSFVVIDDGRGMPVDLMEVKDQVSGKSYKMPAIQAITSLLHAGGKLDKDNGAYATSVGSHGIGQKASNFLSEWFEVTTYDSKKKAWFFIGYENGILKTPLKQLAKPPSHPFKNGKKLLKGTMVAFKPDVSFFSEKKFPLSMVSEWAKMAAYFTDKMRITFSHHSGKQREFYAPDGPITYVEDKLTQLKAESLHPKSFVFRNALVDCVFQFTNYDGCELQAFTNGLNNPEKGQHFNSFFQALYKSIEPYAKPRQKFSLAELKEGLVGLVNVKLSAPQFASQTKEKLIDERAGKPVYDILFSELAKFFKANKSLAEKICARAHELKQLKSQFTASKKTLTELKKSAKKGLPAKASLAPDCKPEERELYLVEGESAGGTAKMARDEFFQELLPLKGKVMNAMKKDAEKALLSEEVLHALNMIGFNPSKSDPLSTLRVGKIILLADPDPDGPLTLDTPVVTEVAGEFKIRSLEETVNLIKEGHEVYVLSWTGQAFRKERAYVGYEGSTDSLIKVKFKDFSVLCTPNHQWPIVVKDSIRWIAAKELKAGLTIAGHPKFGKNELKSLAGHTGFVNHNLIIASVKQKTVSSEKVACLTVPGQGNFLLGNGCLTSNCHINSLLLGLFYKFLPQLYDRGTVYIVDSPEYYEVVGDEVITGSTPQEVQAKLDARKLKGRPHHIKGWGEISATTLEKLAFGDTRKLVRIQPVETEQGVEFVKLMGTGVEARKALLGIE